MADVRLASILVAAVLAPPLVATQDWPQWRFDAGRTANAPHELDDELELQWSREFGARIPAWEDVLNRDLMTYDRLLEPIVLGDLLIVGLSDRDQVVAMEVGTGEVRWRTFVDAPVRMAVAGWKDRVFAASDDGRLHCLARDDGRLLWSFRGGPSDRKVLGNRRLINTWPARGGPVVRDGSVYFAAGIWPFMGTFIYALDAESGEVQWVNDRTSHVYQLQPHATPSFAGVAPQGNLVATDDVLLVPGGRSLPAGFDRATGELLHFRASTGKDEGGGSFVAANDDHFFVHVRERTVASYNILSGTKAGLAIDEPVIDGAHLWAARDQTIQSTRGKQLWQVPQEVNGDLIRAGRRLYASGQDTILGLALPEGDEPAHVVWSARPDGNVQRLIAGADRLFAVTLDGRILAYGSGAGRAQHHTEPVAEASGVAPPIAPAVEFLLDRSTATQGYALCFDADLDTLRMIVGRSELQVVAVHRDPEVVSRSRQELDAVGLYGRRVVVHPGDPRTFEAPPYFARLIWVGGAAARSMRAGDALESVFRSLRPYGGVAWIEGANATSITTAARARDLIQAKVSEGEDGVLLSRPGPLPGAGSWTHQYGNSANTVKSDDQIVRGPLGVLWFGGNSHDDVLPRHGHGPPEQVVGGRLIIEGDSRLSARDVYTGQVLWRTEIEGLENSGVYFNESYDPSIPLSTTYNQKHYPGANARGTNFVATAEEVYVAVGGECRVLDARTGEEQRSIRLPGDADLDWGYLGIDGDRLMGGAGFALFREESELPEKNRHVDFSASRGLAVFDRFTGDLLWEAAAVHGFMHNGIVAGGDRIYCLDRPPGLVANTIPDRLAPFRLTVFDATNGAVLWNTEESVTGTWMGYSAEHDILLLAGSKSRDRAPGEAPKGMIAYRGANGEVLWQDLRRQYTGPPILHGDRILANVGSNGTSAGAWSLLDGRTLTHPHPVTGEMGPWQFKRDYGCNTVVASEHLLTYRSGAAAYFDLNSHSGTQHIGGVRSGCTANLVVADGVLNAPDYTRTCSCHYQQQTSLALVPLSELATWTVIPYAFERCGPNARIRQIGINFGAPGDRMGEDGTPWYEWPIVGGPSPNLGLRVEGSVKTWRRSATAVTGEQRWVAASGLEGVTSIEIPLHPTPPEGIPIARDVDDLEWTQENFDAKSNDLELVEDKELVQEVVLRFEKLKLAPGSSTHTAFVQFCADETGSDPAELEIRALRLPDAPTPLTAELLSTAPRTEAVVRWSVPPWTIARQSGEDQRTPNLAPLLDEIARLSGWKSSHALAFVFTGSGQRIAMAREGGQSKAARLIIRDGSEPPARRERSRRYTVRLNFCEPEDLELGERQFSVAIEGREVLGKFDVLVSAAGARKGVVRVFEGIKATGTLTIALRARDGSRPPILSGIQVIEESSRKRQP